MVLPLIGGMPMRGTGLGPVITVWYSARAINVGAMVRTACVLGAPLGGARGGGVMFLRPLACGGTRSYEARSGRTRRPSPIGRAGPLRWIETSMSPLDESVCSRRRGFELLHDAYGRVGPTGLFDSGMGQGPVWALLLAGPALCLPTVVVIRSILGDCKRLKFVGIWVVIAMTGGLVFGALVT